MRGIDLTGRIFGKLTVEHLFLPGCVRGTRKRTWSCRCECGAETIVTGSNLTTGNTRSCGCERNRLTGERTARRNAG